MKKSTEKKKRRKAETIHFQPCQHISVTGPLKNEESADVPSNLYTDVTFLLLILHYQEHNTEGNNPFLMPMCKAGMTILFFT